jgi:hypothetical protein
VLWCRAPVDALTMLKTRQETCVTTRDLS